MIRTRSSLGTAFLAWFALACSEDSPAQRAVDTTASGGNGSTTGALASGGSAGEGGKTGVPSDTARGGQAGADTQSERGAAGATAGGAPSADCGSIALTASSANNFSFSGGLTLSVVPVAAATALDFDWSDVSADFLGHELDAETELNSASLFMWSLTLEDFEEKLNAGTLIQSDLTMVPLTFRIEAGEKSANLLDFSLDGLPVPSDEILAYLEPEQYDPMLHTFTLMLSTGTLIGYGTRAIQAFAPDPESDATAVYVTDDSTDLDYVADFSGLAPSLVPSREPAITIDWSNLMKNARGNPIAPTDITAATISHYTRSPAELQTHLFELENMASALYRREVPAGTSVNLEEFLDEDGTAFPGIDASGTWLVGLECGGCREPAPTYLTILTACDSEL